MKQYYAVLEADTTSKSLADEFRSVSADTTMSIDLITDSDIEFNELPEVSDPLLFEKGDMPRENGLFSDRIFGTTQAERMKSFAYINLHSKFIHPYIYEILTMIRKDVEKVCSGIDHWKVTEDGDLVQKSKKEVDDDLDDDDTGLDWFIDNYKKIKFKKNNSFKRNSKIDLLETLSKNEIFITKFVVIPVFYRDLDNTGGAIQIPKLNDTYSQLIRVANSLQNDDLGFVNNKAKFKIQSTLVDIRKYAQGLIARKEGFFKKSVIAKNIDYGDRSVISTPILDNVNSPSEQPIDLYHTGIPLAQCVILGFPFIKRWLLEFFKNEFEIRGVRYPVYIKQNGKLILRELQLVDPLGFYTENYIMKRINSFKDNPESRFELVELPVKEGVDAYMVYTGRGFSRLKDSEEAATIATRPITWTDLLYMAASEVLKDKHVYVTRYPLIDYFGIFASRIHVLSTVQTAPQIIDGEEMKYYPVVDLNIPKSEVPVKFVDTVTMANSYLASIGGDYDGDMVSIRMVFTEEANIEAEEVMQHKRNILSIDGQIVRFVSNEMDLAYYNMTKY